MNLEKSVQSVATLAIILGDRDGLADESARRRLRLIVPHMVRASSISLIVADHLRGRATLSDAMDQITAAVFLSAILEGFYTRTRQPQFSQLRQLPSYRAVGGLDCDRSGGKPCAAINFQFLGRSSN